MVNNDRETMLMFGYTESEKIPTENQLYLHRSIYFDILASDINTSTFRVNKQTKNGIERERNSFFSLKNETKRRHPLASYKNA